MTEQLRLDDLEVVEVRARWSRVELGPTGQQALGPSRPGRDPRERDSHFGRDHDPARGAPAA